ncbi:MAG: S8 family serine peptidase, partial [Burkholderiales bacterium]
MSRSLKLVGAGAIAAVATLWPVRADEVALESGASGAVRMFPRGAHREGEVIVAFRDGVSELEMERVLRSGRTRGARRSRFGPRVLAELEPGASVADEMERFSAMPGVAWAEPNGLVWVEQATTFTPNDTLYRFQWNLKQVNAERTWAIQKGQSTVAVAVLDTGIAFEDYTDPVTGQVFRKAPDWGDTRFLPGYDFFNDDAHPNDDRNHGTHVASTIAEGTNNAVGL